MSKRKRWGKNIIAALTALTMVIPGMAVQEFPVRAATGRIALTADMILAKSAKEQPSAMAVDGDTATYWQSVPQDGEGATEAEKRYSRMYDHNRYIDIGLGGTYDLSQIKIFNRVDGSYNNYYVYASADGVTYDKIIAKTSDTLATAEGDSYTVEKQAAYLRLNMAYNSNQFATNLAEIEVYGTRVGNMPEDTSEIHVTPWEGSKWQQEWDRFEKNPVYAEEKVLNEMSHLVGRVLGNQWKSSFQFEMRGGLGDDSDIFEIKDGNAGQIIIRGNSGIALASGFNYYLKNYANVDYNPLFGSNTSMTAVVPVGETIVKEAQFQLRYALNFCTYSYTMAFWNWDEYEEFLDWCAMNGINLVLDIVGQEEVIRQTLREFNYTDEEVRQYISGPAYMAWFYMQNLYSIGGPLPNAWFEQRAELGRRMHDRMQVFGITPVIQGFAGQVPETFPEKNEGAVLTPIDEWVGFTRPSIIQTYLTDADVAAGKVNYFADVAETFYEKQKNVFGDVSDYYATDPFHEGGNTGSLQIADIFKSVQDEMLRSNPKARWVMQQWQGNLDTNKMSKMDKSKAIALDLQADMNPQHELFEENGTPWIYCMLHNFGGRMGLDGEVPVIARDIVETKDRTKNMTGIGITPEALENSPVIYEFFFDTLWSPDPIDYGTWIGQYARRRAGGDSESLQEAWNILLDTAYADKGTYYQGAAETVINARPDDNFGSASTWGHSKILYEKAELDRALLLLKENYEQFSGSEAFKYDLADVSEQVLCNAAVEYHKLMVQAKNAGDIEKFKALSTDFLNLIELSDQILNTTDEFMVGTWIEASRKMITGADDWTKDLMEFNARSLITTWGGARVGSLKDYSNRKWAGLTRDFYRERWSIWIRNRIAEMENTAKDPADDKAERNWFQWEFQWANRKSDDEGGRYAYAVTPSNADLSQMATKAYNDFSYTNLKKNTGNGAEEKVNVAKGKTVTTTSAAASGTLAALTDGDTATEWVASEAGPHELLLDLEEAYQLSEIVISILQLAKQYPYTYKVEAHDPDDGSWSTVVENTDAKMDSNVTISTTATADKIRFTMKTNDLINSPLTLTDLAVYGTPVNAAQHYNWAAGMAPTTNKTNTESDHPLSNITDEDTVTFWKTADWGTGAYPADVTVPLKAAANIEYIDLSFEKPGLPFIFYVTVTDPEGNEIEVFDDYKAHTGVLDKKTYRIPVGQVIQAVNVHMTGITEQGDFYAAGPGIAEIMAMSTEAPKTGAIYTEGKIEGVTVSGGNATGNVLDGDKEHTFDIVEKDEDVVFDLGGAHYVKNVDVTFEKVDLGLKYAVYAEDTSGTRVTLLDKSSTMELLTEKTVSVPVEQVLSKIIFVHKGNNGQGPAYLAEQRLYEVEVFGGSLAINGITGSRTTAPAEAAVLVDGNKNTSYNMTADTPVEIAWTEETEMVGVSLVKGTGQTAALDYTVQAYNKDTDTWEAFAQKSENQNEVFALADGVTTNKIRITMAQDASVAEVHIYKLDQAGPLTSKIRAVEDTLAKLLYDGYSLSYRPEARAAVEALLAEARTEIGTGLNVEEIESWMSRIDKAMSDFYRTGVVYIDRTGLLSAISEAEDLLRYLDSLGETERKDQLQAKYDEAKAVYSTYRKTQAEVDTAKTELAAKITEAAGDFTRVTGVSLNQQTVALGLNGTVTLTAAVAPAGASNKNVTWASTDTGVATVAAGADGTAAVTAKGEGTANIVVKTEDGLFRTVCTVTVAKADGPQPDGTDKNPEPAPSPVLATAIKLNAVAKTLKKGQSFTLTATVAPADVTDRTVAWASSDQKVATVVSGKVVAMGAGTAIITATAADGSAVKATCTITVPYTIKYMLNKGKNNTKNPATYNGKKLKLQNPSRKGYAFKGWYADKKFKKKVTSISGMDMTVYAKWAKVAKKATVIKSAKNSKKGQIALKLKKVAGTQYEITYSTDKKMKKAVQKTTSKKPAAVIKKGLKKGKTYYVRVRTFRKDSAKLNVYSKYTTIKKVKITK